MAKKKNNIEQVHKTETQLKEEALAAMRLQEEAEAKRKPKSPLAKKWENYWFHYKWLTIGVGFGLILVFFFVKDTLFRVDPDYTIVFCSQYYVDTDTLDLLASAMEEYGEDRNGDGQVVVQIDQLTVPAAVVEEEEEPSDPGEYTGGMDSMNVEADYANVMKLMAVIAANTDYIYLVDEWSYDYLSKMAGDGDGSMFLSLQGEVPSAEGELLRVSDTSLGDGEWGEYMRSLTLCLRMNYDTNNKKADYHRDCLDLLKAIGAGAG